MSHIYDLEADPYELTNLIMSGSHHEIATTLRDRLIERMVAASEMKPEIEPAWSSGSQ